MIAQWENVSPGRPCVCVVNAMTGEMMQVGGSVLHIFEACGLWPTTICCSRPYMNAQLIACMSACNTMGIETTTVVRQREMFSVCRELMTMEAPALGV